MKKKTLKKEIDQLREMISDLKSEIALLRMNQPHVVSIPSIFTPICQHEWDMPYQVGDFPPGSIKCKKCGEKAPTMTITNAYMSHNVDKVM